MGENQDLEAGSETGLRKNVVDDAPLQDPERQALPSKPESIPSPEPSNLASIIFSGRNWNPV